MRDIAPGPRRLFGEPIERGGVTIIPVGAPAIRTNGAEPVGAYVVRGERVRWAAAIDGWVIVAALWALASLLVPVAWGAGGPVRSAITAAGVGAGQVAAPVSHTQNSLPSGSAMRIQ